MSRYSTAPRKIGTKLIPIPHAQLLAQYHSAEAIMREIHVDILCHAAVARALGFSVGVSQ